MRDIEDLKRASCEAPSSSEAPSDTDSDSSDSGWSTSSSSSALSFAERKRRAHRALRAAPPRKQVRKRSESPPARHRVSLTRRRSPSHRRCDRSGSRRRRRSPSRPRSGSRRRSRARSGSRRRSSGLRLRSSSGYRRMRSGSRRRRSQWRSPPRGRAGTYRSHSPIGRMTGSLYKAPRAAPAADGQLKRFGMRVSDEDRVIAARNTPFILSVSRRTDVPWGFLRQYLQGFEEGFIYVASGARKVAADGSRCVANARAICVRPYDPSTRRGVVCISWWSKNYQKWIDAYRRPDSVLHRYPVHIFNYTINSDCPDVEPGVETSLEDRLSQATYLANTFGPHALNCRFDPIVHYRRSGGPVLDNLKDFERIMAHLGDLGVDHVTFSFCQAYPKSVRNMRDVGLELVTLTREQEYKVLDRLMPIAHKHGIQMRCCGNKGLVGYPLVTGEDAAVLVERNEIRQADNMPVIGQSRCVDAKLTDRLARERGLSIFLNQNKDLGQRASCECHRSTDIGQYTFQCPHGCVYCYANPVKAKRPAARPALTPGPSAAVPPPQPQVGGTYAAPMPFLLGAQPASAQAAGGGLSLPAKPGADPAGFAPPQAAGPPLAAVNTTDLLMRAYGYSGFNLLNPMAAFTPGGAAAATTGTT